MDGQGGGEAQEIADPSKNKKKQNLNFGKSANLRRSDRPVQVDVTSVGKSDPESYFLAFPEKNLFAYQI
jgi:hypothetical protein